MCLLVARGSSLVARNPIAFVWESHSRDSHKRAALWDGPYESGLRDSYKRAALWDGPYESGP